jgi:anthranilate phosphoribosyltransferase
VMAALGVNANCSPEVQAKCLREIGLCFCWSVHHHPAMQHAAGPRKSLGFPTIFNLLGPLTNPAGAARQLIGCYSIPLAEKIAHTLARLSTEKAMVVSSHDGLDELTITDTTLAFHVQDGRVSQQVIDAAHHGFARARLVDLQANSLESSVALAKAVLSPAMAHQPDNIVAQAQNMTLLTAGAALIVADVVRDFAEAIALARESILHGNAEKTLEKLVTLTN